ALPFYWNLAPNYDWIIKPRKVGGRGTMRESEFRYLHRPGSGLISLGYLPGDQRFNDADRKSAHWEHYGNLDATWRWHSDVSYLSDNDYLNDLGANLSAVGESFLNREWVIEGNKDSWQAQLAVQSYQTIDGAITADDQPYRKLPEARIHHTSNLANDWLEWSNSASYAYLAQPESSVVPYAHRLHWISEFSLPLSGSWYFLTPQTTLQSSYYQLLGTQSTSATRYVPTFSIDGGLFFDRTIPFQHHRWTQTLEPHLFYTYTPFRDQNPLPVFDTTAMTFGFDQLFRANRFSGIDRIGDTHQTTLATTTRFLNENSQELAQLTIGQILYHTDRNVTLPDTLPLTNSQSPIVLRGQTALPAHLTLAGGLTWDSAHNIIEDGNLMLSSVTDINSAWHTSYRYRKAAPSDDRIDQIIFGVRQHLSGFWHIVGSLHFDLEENRTLEQISGFQYEDCCWRADVVYHRRIRSSTDSVDDAANQYSFLMQFELKGLGKLGSRLDELLSENIPGYIRRN
ncbi:MAG: LPS assembly protein LptD, partial [Gammaproteobacteria bacterium]